MPDDPNNLLGEAFPSNLVEGDLSLTSKNKNVRLKDDKRFLDYAQNNRWADRRSRPDPLPWKTDVFDFILIVYQHWLGNGLMQGDIKVADPGLYSEFQKKISVLRRTYKPIPEWIERKFPKERSPEGLKLAFPDEREREKVANFREVLRERVATTRAKRQEPSP